MSPHASRRCGQGGGAKWRMLAVHSGTCSVVCFLIKTDLWPPEASRRPPLLLLRAIFYLFRPLSKHMVAIWRSSSGSISCGLVSTSNEWPFRYPQRVASCELHLSIGAGLFGPIQSTLFYLRSVPLSSYPNVSDPPLILPTVLPFLFSGCQWGVVSYGLLGRRGT